MLRQGLITAVAACLSLAAVPRPVGSDDPPVSLARLDAPGEVAHPATDPVAFARHCRDHVERTVQGYRATFEKQERINGELHPPERLTTSVRLRPYAIRLRWQSGQREVLGSAVEGLVYEAGANRGRLTVWRPSASLGFLRFLEVLPTDAAARQAARYSVTEASLLHAAARTAHAWGKSQDAGTLKVRYDGIVTADTPGNRPCHRFVRTVAPPEVDSFLLAEPAPDPATHPEDAIATVTLWIDAETLLQLGSELRRADGELVARYTFTDVALNPSFAPQEFHRAGLE